MRVAVRGELLAVGELADVDPELPADTAWQPVDDLPPLAFDHRYFVDAAVERLRAKLSYTNIGFALAPQEFPISELRDIVSAALGYEVGATNLTRVLTRRRMIESTRRTASSGQAGGRPATLYRFATRQLTVTDPFAVLKPPPSVRSGDAGQG